MAINTLSSDLYNQVARASLATSASGVSASNAVSKVNNASSVLLDIKRKYPTLAIGSGEKLDAFLSTGVGNIVIDPKLLEKMATDPALKAKVEKEILNMSIAETRLGTMMTMTGRKLVASGAYFDENGNMHTWSISESILPEQSVNRKKRAEQEELLRLLAEIRKQEEQTAMEKSFERLLAEKIQMRKSAEDSARQYKLV